MQNRCFEKLEMDYFYLPVEVTEENLPIVFAGLTRMNMAGMNVTIPHKIRIMELLDDIDPLAAAIGAVNVLCLKNGRSIGYNTDGEGFLTSLESGLSISMTGKRIFIIGSGGAVRAISMTLASKGAQKIFLYNRTLSKAESLAEDVNNTICNCAEVVGQKDKDFKDALQSSDVLINGTSIGMHPHTDVMPLDPNLLFQDLAVADIVYNPLQTKLLQTAQAKGCRTVDGLGMLVYQGARAFELWTGIQPPIEDMFETLHQATYHQKAHA